LEQFWKGFNKQASLKSLLKHKPGSLFKRFGKNKDMVMVGRRGGKGLGREELLFGKKLPKNEDLTGFLKHQPLVDAVTKAQSKLTKWPQGRHTQAIRDELKKRPSALAGTIAKGKKGSKLYMSRTGLKTVAKIQNRPLKEVTRDMVHHEAFHKNVPVLGQSEILAHLYGGLKSKKGKISPTGAVKSLGMLAESRPGRLGVEAAMVGVPTAAVASSLEGKKK